MTTQKFNPNGWRQSAAADLRAQVEIVTARIETMGADIAPAYNDWRDLGFALACGLGEEGRAYFHRLSRFYSGYKPAEADKQYTACLQSRGHGITPATFFHLARQAGVDCRIATLPRKDGADFPAPPSRPSSGSPAPCAPGREEREHPARGQEAGRPEPLPSFPDEVYASLPRLLTDVCSYGLSPEDTDILLLGALTVLSSCLTQVWGLYGQRQVFPNLFLFISAQASAGKGRLTLCRHLADVVHADLRMRNRKEWEEYRSRKALYDKRRKDSQGEEPQQPPVRMLFIPANSTATALFQTLNDNDGRALMFETEGDTLATTFRSEHGNYSDGLRKAFHHEPITYNRRKDREYVEIAMPRLSVLLSGTPGQISALIPDAENGLFSRFLFYTLPMRPAWNDVFAGDENDTLDNRFIRLGGRFFQFYRRLSCSEPMRFALTRRQQTDFNRFFAELQEQGMRRFGVELLPSVRRLGLSAYRICMTLSVLRLMDYEGDTPLPATLLCGDDDFRAMLLMMPVLMRHTALAFASLKAEAPRPDAAPAPAGTSHRECRRNALLNAMPDAFDRAQWQQKAAEQNVPVRTADRYLIELCNNGRLLKPAYDSYRKPPAEGPE